MSGFVVFYIYKFSAVVYNLVVGLPSVEYNQIIKCSIVKQAVHLFAILA